MADKLSIYLHDAPGLKTLAQRLNRIQELQHLYLSIVPAHVARASRIGDVTDNTVVIIATNGVAATGLKQRLPSLLARIQEWSSHIDAVRVEVQVENSATPAGRRHPLSAAGASSLGQLAASLPSSPLQQAVDRLAMRALDQHEPLDDIKESDRGK